MDNFTSLKSSLQAIQQIINLDVVPAFDDLSNNSEIFNDLISAQSNIQLELNNINTLVESNVIKGDTGLQGIQGLNGVDGLNGTDGLNGVDGQSFVLSQLILTKTSDSSTSVVSSASIPIPELSIPSLDENSIYEFQCFVNYRSVATTTGINLSLKLPTNAVFYGDITIPLTYLPSASSLRMFSPNMSNSTFTSTGVGSTSIDHTAIFRGIIKNGAIGALTALSLMFASEVSGSAVTVKAGSFLILKRIL